MKFGVVVFPGSNCDMDMQHVLEEVLQQEVQMLWHKDTELEGFEPGDCIVLPGGFSYGDYLRSGAIARFSPIMPAVIDFANKGGFVLGICNGFQILCEAGLLPGTLQHNNSHRFICKNSHLTVVSKNTALTADLDAAAVYTIPIAHAEGRYYADEQVLEQLKQQDQILFCYCDANGAVTEEANPNGALENIAGICNEKRNVFGMMPHPERAAETVLGNTDGLALFQSLINNSAVPA